MENFYGLTCPAPGPGPSELIIIARVQPRPVGGCIVPRSSFITERYQDTENHQAEPQKPLSTFASKGAVDPVADTYPEFSQPAEHSKWSCIVVNLTDVDITN